MWTAVGCRAAAVKSSRASAGPGADRSMWTTLSVPAARRSSLGGAGGADWRLPARSPRRRFSGATRSPVDGAPTFPGLGFLGSSGAARVAPPPAPLRTPEQQSSMVGVRYGGKWRAEQSLKIFQETREGEELSCEIRNRLAAPASSLAHLTLAGGGGSRICVAGFSWG